MAAASQAAASVGNVKVARAVEAGSDVTLHLGGIDHLDASALQIVLALDAEQEEQGRHLHLANASAHLREWFEYAGVAEHFFPTE